MSMSKEDGWEDYHCYTCSRPMGHFYVGFGLGRIYRMLLMKLRTVWNTCTACMMMNKLRLRGRLWMISTPVIENSWFQKVWDEARENEG